MRASDNPTGGKHLITALAIASRWPRPAWSSRFQRALYQAHRLAKMEAQSSGELMPVKARDDLAALLKARAAAAHAVGALLALEGSQAVEGNRANLDALYEAGFGHMAAT